MKKQDSGGLIAPPLRLLFANLNCAGSTRELRIPVAARGRAGLMLDNSWVDNYMGLPYALPLMELLRRHAYLLASRITRTTQFLFESAMPAFDGNPDAASSKFKMTHRCLQWADSFLPS